MSSHQDQKTSAGCEERTTTRDHAGKNTNNRDRNKGTKRKGKENERRNTVEHTEREDIRESVQENSNNFFYYASEFKLSPKKKQRIAGPKIKERLEEPKNTEEKGETRNTGEEKVTETKVQNGILSENSALTKNKKLSMMAASGSEGRITSCNDDLNNRLPNTNREVYEVAPDKG